MGEFSKIEWTDHTWNPWIGCQHVSPGCDHCYAEAQNKFRKWNGGEWGARAPRKRTSEANWRKPLQWNKAAQTDGIRAKVFCASLGDWLDNKAEQSMRIELAELIRATPNLDWLLLTKRIENYKRLAPWSDVPRNVWLGVTCEDQHYFDRRWAVLNEIDAKCRFISYEPALGPLKLGCHNSASVPDWIICGGESGAGARMMKRRWARKLRDECKELGVAFFMKQMTARKEIPSDLLVRQFPRA
jgi:protein gp37